MSYRFEHKERTYWVKEMAKKTEVYRLSETKGPVAELALEADSRSSEAKIKALLDIQAQLDQEIAHLDKKMSGNQ